ncbi:MAG: sulfur reduction protein DsrE [Candidatus Edwardsbacteria bacterium RIFOXYD12_FULL_50_11]|uniref:Sulfur reduction protein DsrE n=1 Tax=Candidatus Edwardsbacteria bacterium GWF2_54_11 TaxID=1817851 RepID=A0A1F5RCQ8_9BACT|nr:MAG: sulfur reduction protein DsrE [Candidatus Edwardsbacteria bacterium RifOxyC12_full_54_24]OGF08024.1 MAG: sulfur reduction protein DsrE [Candidatus Edwardsbacteria bacterium RifOxyA12_full_54_48]OGF10272.1 MAG: sulfur reduction protein DsrE [Candidatus Edwardsbacteria bacterium GWE2_54_12]OGF12259.1 MAG: sulfur reduction protein DsrE [Candidatus Edwardsbacteria bacterium GWF2_54_11]OGF16340.1 MAG: sulfur reduction protein DsrE [Candidatus Edwardsbacteria bacterium RIFOXYD12_FULL_50_11]O
MGIIIYSQDAETVWNAFRLGVYSLGQGDQASVFLLAKGVDCQSLDSDQLKVTEQMQAFHDQGGRILACGTCLKMRHQEGTEMCPLSSMKDLYEMIKTSDKVVSF